MTQKLKLLFDECISKPAVEALKIIVDYSDGDTEIAHLQEYFLKGELDSEWIPKIASEGWIILTTDRGKHKTQQDRLPILCAELQITHVRLTRKLHAQNTFHKICAILAAWEDFLGLTAAPKGSRHSLSYSNKKAELTALPAMSKTGPKREKTLPMN